MKQIHTLARKARFGAPIYRTIEHAATVKPVNLAAE